jgi:hypothetical protein
MLQLVLATAIADRVAGLEIAGYDIPLWGLRGAPARAGWLPSLKGHHVDADLIVRLYRSGLLTEARLTGLGFRCEAYGPPARYHDLFPPKAPARKFGRDVLLIHIRAGDVLHDVHPHYGPLPHAYYERVISETGLRPVFCGQLDDNPYTTALRARFPDAEFLQQGSVAEDFETLRAAANLVCSIGTFSWMAAWLSGADRVFLPVAGMFNPDQRPDVNLLPIGDARYIFHAFPIRYWRASAEDFAALQTTPAPDPISHAKLHQRLMKARRAQALPRLKAQARLLLSGLRR